MKRSLLPALIVIWITASPFYSAAAERLRACYPAIAGNIAPIWIAKEKAFFAKQGLEVDLTYIRGGTTATAAMLSGEVSFCMIAGAAVIQSQLSGSDLVMVAGITNTFDFTVFGAKGITSVEDLRGKKAGINRFGSSSDFAMRYLLERNGLKPGHDVAVLQVGGTIERVAALETGSVQATLVNPPMTLVARKKGFTELADLGKLGIEYQHVGLVASERYLRDNRDQARRFIRAFMEAIRFYRNQKDATLQTVKKYLIVQEAELLEETYEKYLDLIPKKPYPTLKGIEFILKEIGRNDPRARRAYPKNFVDASFVKELDESGFFDR
ncbi:MAG: ABC transporter substrate-binding protein [Deltaproteobacteria bacterium]|nr:ABC transporter substrate-binding protein [Deltaproteobacteria bacterium]